ncbi:hypothetical protein CNYM01_06004 [Colletotrichum nymphaeae SA-01]|uniref:Uncharacterized protein n=1 Tax=Colletotrichum nymphaeae SA-01 TaxID=1460502 RepID=A0A135SSJ5_9PEZI|nr:hypothetical protein CNYM01_06004 [Colletotrichum nymphaeae SA-01]
MDRTDHPHSNPRLRIEYGSKAGLAAFYASRNNLVYADICSMNSALGKRVWDTNTAISLLDAWMLHPNPRRTKFGLWNAVAAQRRLKKNFQDFGPLKIPKYRTSSHTTALEGSAVSSSSAVICAVILDGVGYGDISCNTEYGRPNLFLGPPSAFQSWYVIAKAQVAAAAAKDASLRVADIPNPFRLGTSTPRAVFNGVYGSILIWPSCRDPALCTSALAGNCMESNFLYASCSCGINQTKDTLKCSSFLCLSFSNNAA